jgi:hypothetical protein
MPRLVILALLIGLATDAAVAQWHEEPQESPKVVIEQFHRMQTEGRWLGPEHWDELQNFVSEVSSWSPPDSISVLQSYAVGDPRRATLIDGSLDRVNGRAYFYFEVDYLTWGTIDSFFNFKRAGGLSWDCLTACEPVRNEEQEQVHPVDHVIKSSMAGDQEIPIPLGWRVGFNPPSVDVISLDVAIRWMAETRSKLNDPALIYNAEKTLAILRSLSTGAPVPAAPSGSAKESPSHLVKRFISLESRSLPDEWDALADFFVESPKPNWDKAHIVDIVDTGATADGNSAEGGISTNSLGDLDSSARLSNYPSMRTPLVIPSTSACFGDDMFGFTLLLTDKHWEIAGNGAVRQSDGPVAWRIEDTSFEPLITLDTAIRYVRRMRDSTSDPVIKANALRTLRILKYYKQGKLLPAALSSSEPGGCG